MGKKKTAKLDVTSLPALGHLPFASLGERLGLAVSEKGAQDARQTGSVAEPLPSSPTNPILLIRREKRKKGKIVTCIYHVTEDAAGLAKRLKRHLATGGTVEGGAIILQGDQREKATAFLRELGFRSRES